MVQIKGLLKTGLGKLLEGRQRLSLLSIQYSAKPAGIAQQTFK